MPGEPEILSAPPLLPECILGEYWLKEFEPDPFYAREDRKYKPTIPPTQFSVQWL